MRDTILTLTLGILLASGASAQEHPVREVSGIPYASGEGYAGDRGELDLYVPEGVEGFPVLISLHGGGLLTGDKAEEAHIGHRFAGAGVGTVVINYRLSPRVSHPAHIQDVAKATAWVTENIGGYGGDPDGIFVMGHSAGGYLAGLVATDPRYLEAEGLSLGSLRGAIPVSGFFYVDEVAPDRPEHVWGTDPEAWLEASPHTHLRSDAPPFLLLYADGDAPWRREQHERFARDLRGVGHRDVDVREFADRSHSGIWSGMAEAEDVSEAVLRFIRERTATAALAASASSQVRRGSSVFETRCANCHVGQGAMAPTLGPSVLGFFSDAGDLHDFVARFMPYDAPGSLEEDEYWAVLAYLLSEGELLPGGIVLGPGNAAEIPLRPEG